jgi:hypothetical protein
MFRPGDTVSEMSAPIVAGASLQFTWDVGTTLSWSAYEDWLAAHLTLFRVADRTVEHIVLSRYTGADWQRLEVVFVSSASLTQAHVTFTLAPD